MAARRPKVALNRSPVTSQLLLISCRDGRNRSPLEITSSLEMGVAHEADPNDSNPDHAAPLINK